MSSEALDGYARMIERRGGELVRSLIGLMSANMNSKPKTSGNGDGDAKEGGGEIEVDMSEWISYFSFDFMGDMAYVLSNSFPLPFLSFSLLAFPRILMRSFHRFGEGFDMMKNHGDKNGHWKTIEDFL